MSGNLDDLKKRILARISLRDLVGERVKLVARGNRHWACCPFHAEKSPSFTVFEDRYYCFGCKASGDAIEFVRQTQGMSFIEALRVLAAKAGIDPAELDALGRGFREQVGQASLYKMMVEAHEFYRSQLTSERGNEAKDYLRGRGFDDESIAAYGFGLTPQESYGLVRYLRSRGYKERDMMDCGLATHGSRDGKPFDFFRERIIIPIKDAQGRIIAFGGRTISGHSAKYVNSRESKLFDKSRVLFGFDEARQHMRPRGRALVVEGYMDALQLKRSGFVETVACLGTALTESHLKLLRQATSEVILLFDGDAAGRRATLASVSVALTVPEVRVRAAVLPGGLDPDDFIRQHGAEALERELAGAADLLDFAIRERIKATHKLGLPHLLKQEILPWLAKTPDPLLRGVLASRVAELTGIPVAEIRRQLAPAPVRPVQPTKPAPQPKAMPLDKPTEELFGHLFHSTPGEIDLGEISEFVTTRLRLGEAHLFLFREMVETLQAGKSPADEPLSRWDAGLDPEILALIERLKTEAAAYECNDRAARVGRLILVHRRRHLEDARKTLKSEMSRLARTPESEGELRQILAQLAELERDINNLEKVPPSPVGP